MEEIRNKIPKECFEKNLGKSLYYMFRDWAIVGILYYL